MLKIDEIPAILNNCMFGYHFSTEKKIKYFQNLNIFLLVSQYRWISAIKEDKNNLKIATTFLLSDPLV